MNNVFYKLRNADGNFSHGVISKWRSAFSNVPVVKWSKKGKEWKTEKGVKDHLLKWLLNGGGIPPDWEIVEVRCSPTKPIAEWVDQEMLMKVLKSTGKQR